MTKHLGKIGLTVTAGYFLILAGIIWPGVSDVLDLTLNEPTGQPRTREK